MHQPACHRLILLLVLALGAALASSEAFRPLDAPTPEGSRHRRSLLAATQQISQCDWIQGEGCALHPAYASYALNRSSDDVVAQYVSNALACATATDKGLCESASYCYWDTSFSNGQQGCFLHDDALLSLQLRCVQQQYLPSLSKLQACMAARQSCQCSGSTSSSASTTASCTQRQQQLLTGYAGSSKEKVCRSLLGCWLSSLNATSTDITQLVETQLLIVQPKIESLSSGSGTSSNTSSSNGGGRRRALQQTPPSLSDPVLDDKSSSTGYTPESGSYGGGSSSSTPAGAPSVGMNGVVTDDQAATPVIATTPVENGKNVPAPNRANGSSSSNTSAALRLESALVNSSDWALEQAPVDPDQVFGSSGGGAAAGSTTSSSDGSSSVQMTGGNAPASFWQCAADAAAKADTTRKWADVAYNSKTLTLATWIKVIQPTSLIDWGVQVMECFKTEVPKTSSLDTSTNSSSTKPNKESLEFAIVALIRAFSGQAEAFRSYLQAGTSRPTAGLAALSRLANEVYPGQLTILTTKYQGAPAYRRDVMLQATSLIADLQWFATDVLSMVTDGEAASREDAFEGYINYSEEMVRRCLYWLFYVQFDGPPAHLPGPIPSSAASSAVVAAFEGLAAAALPASMVAGDSPAWQQLQVMTATAAGSAAASAAQYGADFDSSLVLSNTVAGLARAHVQDLWGSRLELARAGAPEASRELALRDPNEKSTKWEPLRKQQLAMLAALQERAAQGRKQDGSANLQLSRSLQDLVAASGAYLLSGNAGIAAQLKTQQELSDALGLAAQLSLLIRQCHGSPTGLAPLSAAAAAKAGIPAAAAEACSQLADSTGRLAAVGQGGIIGGTLLADLDRQWRCNAVPAAECSSKAGCALALAPVLVPGMALSGTDNMVMACQAADASLFLSSLDSSTKSALAVGQTCEQFLKLPACEMIGNASTCSSTQTCRWELSTQRNVLHTATAGAAAAKAAAAPGSKGVCAMDWVSVLSSSGSGNAYSGLNSMIQLCSGISDSGQCESQTMLITLDAPAPGSGSSMARIWVPALVIAGVVGLLLFGAAIWWRRHSAAARRAAEEARLAAGGGRGGRRGGKDGKGGKGAKGTKKKPKRAEPGSYKPDLMRDSFTDYMRAAPQQFNNGVAIAKAAMATGDLDTAVAVADVAGGRQLSAGQALAPGGRGDSGRRPSSPTTRGSDSSTWGLGVVPAAASPARSQGSTDLINLSHSDGSGHTRTSSGSSGPVQPQQQQRQQPAAASPAPAAAGGVWGSAVASGHMGLAGSPPLVSPRGLGGAPAGLDGRGLTTLQGGLSVPVNLLDANASIALTSSINLLSSLPQHGSLPVGLLAEQQQHDGQLGLLRPTAAAGGPPGASRAQLGAGYGLGRISSSSLGGSAFGGRGSAAFDNAHSGSLLLPSGSRGPAGGSDDGCTTPTSSCCHDSVCTFGPGPGSVVSSTSGGRPASTGPPSLRSHSSQRLGAAAAGAHRAGGPGGLVGAGGSVQPGALAASPSMPLSRSSWSSAMSTDLLMSTQNSSAIVDP